MALSSHPGPAVCGLDTLFGLLGAEVKPGQVLRLNRAEHLRVVQTLHHTFERWQPPQLEDGHYRAVLALPGEFAIWAPIAFTSVAVFAHQVALRDPFDVWLREYAETGDRLSTSLQALDGAVQQALPLRPLIDAEIMLFMPTPWEARVDHPVKEFLRARDGVAFQREGLVDRPFSSLVVAGIS